MRQTNLSPEWIYITENSAPELGSDSWVLTFRQASLLYFSHPRPPHFQPELAGDEPLNILHREQDLGRGGDLWVSTLL